MRTYNYILGFIAATAMLTACEKSETGFGDMYNGDKISYTIDLDKTDALTLDANAQQVELRVGANYWWTLSTEFIHNDGEYETDWLEVLSGDSSYGNKPIKVSFKRNVEQRERSVKFVFTAQDDNAIQREITFTQKAANLFVEVDMSEKNLSILSQSFNIVLSASGEWSVQKPHWVTLGKSAGTSTRDESIEVSVLTNDTDANRSGVVVFSSVADPNVKHELKINQSGIFAAPQISLVNDNDFTVTFDTDPGTLYYTVDVYKTTEPDNIFVQKKITDFSGETVVDLTTIDYQDYVGSIGVRVSAYLSDAFFKSSDTVTTNGYFAHISGAGTVDAPLIVSNLRHFGNVARALDMVIRQDSDLDFKGTERLSPIGTLSKPFTGTYDGNGKKIVNMSFESISANAPAAIFPYVSGGTIKGLTAENVSLTIKDKIPSVICSAIFVGLLKSGGTVENCHLNGCKIDIINEQNVTAAGIVGYNDTGKISGCTTTGGYIQSNKGCNLGGVVGINGKSGEATESIVEKCENISTPLRGTTGMIDVGGIAFQNNHTIKGCVNRATLTGSRFVGGIASSPSSTNNDANNMLIEGCANYGNITLKPNAPTSLCGGIMGRAASGSVSVGAVIKECFNAGTITMEKFTVNPATIAAAGISAQNNYLRVSDCYNVGNVVNNSGNNAIITGGILGNVQVNGTSVVNCYSVGEVPSAAQNSKTGAIVAAGALSATVTFTDCFYLSGLPDGVAGSGTALTDTELKTQASYTNWDFTTVWKIDGAANNGYPTLQSLDR